MNEFNMANKLPAYGVQAPEPMREVSGAVFDLEQARGELREAFTDLACRLAPVALMVPDAKQMAKPASPDACKLGATSRAFVAT